MPNRRDKAALQRAEAFTANEWSTPVARMISVLLHVVIAAAISSGDVNWSCSAAIMIFGRGEFAADGSDFII